MKSSTVKESLPGVARGTTPEGGSEGQAEPRRLLRFATVLVPIDYSGPSGSAFEYALELAEKFESRVCLLHVLENKTTPDFDTFPLAASRRTTLAGARRDLVQFAKTARHPFVPVFPEVRAGEPWEEIVAAARREKADLIIISTHGRTGLKHVLMGSVAEKVVRHAPCPVLVLRQDQVDLLVTPPGKKTNEMRL